MPARALRSRCSFPRKPLDEEVIAEEVRVPNGKERELGRSRGHDEASNRRLFRDSFRILDCRGLGGFRSEHGTPPYEQNLRAPLKLAEYFVQ